MKADARNVPFEDDSFHEVHLHSVITVPLLDSPKHRKDVVQMVREAHRVLKPGGQLIVITDKFPALENEEKIIRAVKGFYRPRNAGTKIQELKKAVIPWKEPRARVFVFKKRVS